MSYRQSSYDPLAFEQPGPPLRPFNWVQWLGVVSHVAGLALFLAYLAGRIGWIETRLDTGVGLAFMLLGTALINSRREPSSLVGPEQREKNKRVLLITLAVCAVVIAAAFALEYLGATP